MAEGATYCARHPHVETTLLCGRCETPICPRCLVQTPVGARCPTCANVRRLPMLEVSPVYLMRGIGAALVAGVLAGAAWGFLMGRAGVGFFLIFIGMGIGYAVGEGVSAATNRKRAPALQWCAVGGVIVAYLARNAVIGAPPLPAGDLWGYVAVVIAAFYARTRVGP